MNDPTDVVGKKVNQPGELASISLQNCQEGRPLCSGQTGTNSGVCVLWGHQPTHTGQLTPALQAVSQPRRSGSEARQSALQVDKGQWIPAPRRSGQGSCPSRPSTPSKCPCKVRACRWALLPPASYPKPAACGAAGPAGQRWRASPPGPAQVLSFFS